jgi:succinate dehydrogenase assembly factor 2
MYMMIASTSRLLVKTVTKVTGRSNVFHPASMVLSSGVVTAPTASNSITNPNMNMNLVPCRRWYRGDSSEATVVPTLSPHEEELLQIAHPRAIEIYEKHIQVPIDDVPTRQKRLVYRSKQRGWLEVDLLLGTWASTYVPTLSSDELDQFEDFVNMETIDIYNIITLRLDVPDHMKREGGVGVVEKIQDWARSSPLGRADPETYKSVKTEHKLI